MSPVPPPPTLAIRCPYCGTPKPAGEPRCVACGAVRVRRLTPLGRVLIYSVVCMPIYALLRLLWPATVSRKTWEHGDLHPARSGGA